MFFGVFLCVYAGFSFPTLKESDAMFLSEKAPDWHDGELCHRCRVQFGLVQRKVDHHLLPLFTATGGCGFFSHHKLGAREGPVTVD